MAIIPGVGFLRSFAADDLIVPLADLGIDDAFLQSAYAENLAETGLSTGTVDDTAYALMVKLNSKSTVWYRPDLFAEGGYEVAGHLRRLRRPGRADHRGRWHVPWRSAPATAGR